MATAQANERAARSRAASQASLPGSTRTRSHASVSDLDDSLPGTPFPENHSVHSLQSRSSVARSLSSVSSRGIEIERANAELLLQQALRNAEVEEGEETRLLQLEAEQRRLTRSRELRAQRDNVERLRLEEGMLSRSHSRQSHSSSSRSVSAASVAPSVEMNVHASVEVPRQESSAVDSWIDSKSITLGQTPPVTSNVLSSAPWMMAMLPNLSLEFKKFNGDPRTWLEFISSFKGFVHDVVPSNVQRMSMLREMLGPNVRVAMGRILSDDPSHYPAVLARLKSRYGNPTKIARAHIFALQAIKPCKSGDFQSLVEFWNELRGSVSTFQLNGDEHELKSGSNVIQLVEKLPRFLQSRWGRCVQRLGSERPTLVHLDSFLENYIEGEELGRSGHQEAPSERERDDKKGRQQRNVKGMRAPTILKTETTQPSKWCLKCEANTHQTTSCSSFLSLDPTKRAESVLKSGFCFRCLSGKHRGTECTSSKTCTATGCKHKHHPLLHGADRLFPSKSSTRAPAGPFNDEAVADVTVLKTQISTDGSISMVIPIELINGEESIQTFGLLDTAATATLIRDDMASQLGLKGDPQRLNFGTFQGTEEVDTSVVSFQLNSIDGSFRSIVPAGFSVPVLNASNRKLDLAQIKSSFKYLQGIHFPNVSCKDVTVLIGQDVPLAHEQLDSRKPPRGTAGPVAYKTPFGWTLFGSVSSTAVSQPMCRIVDAPKDEIDLHGLVHNFWSAEAFGIKVDAPAPVSQESKRALDLMKSTIKMVDGKYEVGLLWKSTDTALPDNYGSALHRLYKLEGRFKTNPELVTRYQAEIEGHISRGHCVKVSNDDGIPGRLWKIPHHSVINPMKPEKMRVVFDASARFKGASLNEALMTGPDLLTSLFGVLMRFRRHKFAVSADIEKMFYQVSVPKADRSALRFFWRTPGSTCPPDLYEMTVHVFGAVCSPTICTFALRQTIIDNPGQFEDVASKVTECFYVDNYLDSFESSDEAEKSVKELTALLQRGGFRLNQWISSSRKVLRTVPQTELIDPQLDLDLDQLPIERTLGITWNCELDEFSFKLKVCPEASTKRQILSAVMSVFDPLGFLSPVVLVAKILLQDIWREEKLSWDDSVPSSLQLRWRNWAGEMASLRQLKIPRCLWNGRFGLSGSDNLQLHVFCDASQQGYGSAVYLRYTANNTHHVAFLASKALVAPIRSITIPKSELQAARIGFRLANQITSELRLPTQSPIYWTDSQTVLQWLNSSTCRFQAFVANRVGEILEESAEGWNVLTSRTAPSIPPSSLPIIPLPN